MVEEEIMARKGTNTNRPKPVQATKVKETVIEPEVIEEAKPVEEEKPVPCKHFAKVIGVKSGLRLRTRPSTDSDVLDILNPDEQGIEVLEESGEWTKVQVNDSIGFVMSKFIEVF